MLMTRVFRFLVTPLGMVAAMGWMGAKAEAHEGYDYGFNFEYELRHEGGEWDVEEEDRVDEGEAFGEELAPHGRWIETEEYGRCWTPVGVAVTWRPYTVGHWTYTTCGWMWVTTEPWGRVTYHYGRWVYIPCQGWAWVPGRVWAPAWVVWRYGEGYVGWAPMPATPRYRAVVGYPAAAIPTTAYTFVEERHIADREIHHRTIPVERNITIINRTTNITKIEVENRRVINRGVPVERVERIMGRPVERGDEREIRRPAPDRNRLVTGHMAARRPEVAVERRPVMARPPQVQTRHVEERAKTERVAVRAAEPRTVEARRAAETTRDRETARFRGGGNGR